MNTIKLGYYLNPIMQNNIITENKSKTKRKKLTQSLSERYVLKKDKYINNNNLINSKNNSIVEDYKIKKIDIKFNILNNIKKPNNTFNKNYYKRLINSYEENKQINSKFPLKILNNSPILIKNTNCINDNIEHKQDNNNKQNQLDPHNYFPEDFSLNIYKTTSLYKNRYKIQTSRLKRTLSILYKEENSKKSKNLNNIIKKNTIQNNLSIKMFKLLKAKKIDRFVDRLLNIKTITPKSHNKNSTDNNNIKNKENFFITNKNKDFKKMNYNEAESDRNKNAFMHQYTTNIINENNKTNNTNSITNRNISYDIFKNNTANSATQTININDNNNNNYFFYYTNEIDDKSSKDLNKYINLNNRNNRLSCKNYSELKFDIVQLPKKNIFLKKFEKKRRPFSATKTNSSFLNKKNNNNIINKFNKDKKLIFSFYDPKDKYIQIFEEIEKKGIDSKIHI